MIFQIDISQILYSLSRKMLGIQKVFVLQNSNSAPFGKKFTFLFRQIFLSNFNRGATIARFDKVTIQYGGRYLKKKLHLGFKFSGLFLLNYDRSRIHKTIIFHGAGFLDIPVAMTFYLKHPKLTCMVFLAITFVLNKLKLKLNTFKKKSREDDPPIYL